MRLLHLAADYPDPLVPTKTKAVANLLGLVPGVEHRVYALNRVGWRAGIHGLDFADANGSHHRAVAYGAPGRGIWLKTRLERLADWILDDLGRAFVPDAVHAHKLSVEGIAGWRLARRLGVPLLVSVQGDSDLKILGVRRDLHGLYRQIWQGAAAVFPFAPWTAGRVAAALGPRTGPMSLLPCPAGGAETVLPPRVAGPLFRTAFHLGSAGRKNADGLIRAVGLAAARIPDISLEIIGGGDPAAFAALARLAAEAAPGRVRFLGAVPNDAVGTLLNGACALPLISHRESYGMVFAEALLAGTPCLMPSGWGLDGLWPDGGVTLSVPAGDTAAIAAGLERLVREEAAFKARLAALAEEGGLARLQRPAIGRTYATALEGLAAASGAAA